MTMAKKAALAIVALVIFSLSSFLNLSPALAAAPATTSKYVCLIDSASGQVVYGKNIDEKRQVASATKMMTAILAVEYAVLDEIATVSPNADQTPEYTIGLPAGSQLTIEELLKAALIKSANDAAVVLAEHVAGDEMLFAHLMSLKAFAIGAVNTRYENASGLPGHKQYSTAYDQAVIGRYLMSKAVLKNLVGSQVQTFKHPHYREALQLYNTNGLLFSYPGADGIKTGTTNAAGKCLVASATREGRQLIAVALKSYDRNGDCKRLLDYGFNHTGRVLLVHKDEPFKEILLTEGKENLISLYPDKDIYLWMGDAQLNVEKRVLLDYDIKAPVGKNQVLGTLKVYVEGKPVAEANLRTQAEYGRRPGFLLRILDGLARRWGVLPGSAENDP